MLHFASKDVTFRVNVTFCVNCYILRRNIKCILLHLMLMLLQLTLMLMLLQLTLNVRSRGKQFCFPESPDVSRNEVEGTSGLEEKQN